MNNPSSSRVKDHLDNLKISHVIIVLAILGFVAFGNAVRHPFVHDDVIFIQKNPHIHELGLSGIFLKPLTAFGNSEIINVYYRPMLELFYRLQYRLFEFDPHGYHLFNILLHIANAILIFIFSKNIFSGFLSGSRMALAASVLFLVHPVQSEAVACISGISNTLFTFFCLLSVNFYLFSKHAPAKGIYYLGLSALALFLALLSKEQAVMLPFIILLYESTISGGTKSTNDIRVRFAVLFLVVAGYFFLRKVILGAALHTGIRFDHEFMLRILSIPKTLLVYLKTILFPAGLHYYRSQDILEPFIIPAIGLLAIVVAAVFLIRKAGRPHGMYIVFGLFWFLIWLLPVLNIVPIINEYSLILTSEHFLYLPMAGIVISALACADLYFRKKSFSTGFSVFSVLVLLLVALTIKQNTYWKDEVTLFKRVLQFERDFARGHNLLAKAYYAEGKYKEAVEENEKALKIMQGYRAKAKGTPAETFYLGFIKGIHFDLAQYFQAGGDLKQALENYHKALAIDPRDDVILNNVGIVYLSMKDKAQAFYYFQKAAEIDPDAPMVLNNLAICYIERGDKQAAEKLLRRAVSKDPHFMPAQKNLDKLLKSP